MPQLALPFALHERLRGVKFALLLLILGLSLGELEHAIRAARVEPFKTTIVLRFADAWRFVAWALALLAAGLVIEAEAEDGTIEAVRVAEARTFALGVQWHPEWRPLEDPVSRRLFAAFGAAVRARARARTLDAVPTGLTPSPPWP